MIENEVFSMETARLAHKAGYDINLGVDQSILQRWLREVHNLHIEVKVMDSVTKVEYYWSVFGQYNDTRFIRCLVNSPIENYTSYEIALENTHSANQENEAIKCLSEITKYIQGIGKGEVYLSIPCELSKRIEEILSQPAHTSK